MRSTPGRKPRTPAGSSPFGSDGDLLRHHHLPRRPLVGVAEHRGHPTRTPPIRTRPANRPMPVGWPALTDCGLNRQQRLAKSLSRKQKGLPDPSECITRSPDPTQRGRVTNARRRDGADLGAPPACGGHPSCAGETSPMTREPRFTPHQRPEPTTPEKGGADQLTKVVSTRFN
jgi:hypothetical protein